MPRSTPLVLLALLAAFVRAAGAAEPPKPRPAASREEIEAVEATIARAVDRVSLPHAARLLGRAESARGYRLPGYGVVLVLTPRTLPGGEGQIYVVRGAPKRRLRAVTPHAGTGEAPAADEEAIETFERQVLVLQHETEAARRAAEEEAERILHDVRVRVATPSEVHVEMVPPPPPEPPSAPAAAVPAAPPPWKFWFETGTQEEKRTPEKVISDVRGALVDALTAGRVRFTGLAGDERVTVTVDFVPGGIFAASARPEKTLLVSARAKDLDARARGALTPEELSKRVEVVEY
jgi:hypothetical protein